MRILFDATFGEGWVEALKSFYRTHKEPKPRLLHLYDIFDRDVKDDEWIPRIVGQDCLIITADTGRDKPRLTELCKQHKRTHIIFSPTMLNKVNQFQKARAIVVLWPDIVAAFTCPSGSRFQIQAMDINHERFRLVRKGVTVLSASA